MGSAPVDAATVRARGCNSGLRFGLFAELTCSGDPLERGCKLHSRILGHSNCTVYPLATTNRPKAEDLSYSSSRTILGLGFPDRSLGSAHYMYERGSEWLENSTIILAVTSLTWAFGGWPLLSRVWPAIAYLVFILPLPPIVNELLALPLQSLAATSSNFLLQLTGIWVIQDGNVINLSTPHGPERIDVALACNGLRMLMTFAATVMATVFLLPLPNWKRIALLLSIVPIALVSNMTRIVATGWAYYLFEGPTAKHWAHDWAGYMMMPLALALVATRAGSLLVAGSQRD